MLGSPVQVRLCPSLRVPLDAGVGDDLPGAAVLLEEPLESGHDRSGERPQLDVHPTRARRSVGIGGSMPAPVPSIAERSLLLGSALIFGSFAALLAALEIAVLIQPSRLIGYSEAEWLGLFGLWIPAVATVSAMGARVLGSRALRRTARAARPRRRRFSLSIAWVIPWLILCDWRWREAANLRMEQGEAVRREGVRRMLRLVPTNGDAQHGSVLFDALSCQGCHGRAASGTSAAPGLWRLADRSAIRRGDQTPWVHRPENRRAKRRFAGRSDPSQQSGLGPPGRRAATTRQPLGCGPGRDGISSSPRSSIPMPA